MEVPRLIVDADVSRPFKTASGADQRLYNVKLHFSVPPTMQSGPRQFDVFAQGKLVLDDVRLDKAHSTTSYLLQNIPISDALELRFAASEGLPTLAGIEMEVVE